MLKLGIIGSGSIVESCHLPVIKNIKQIEVCWIYDKNALRSELLAKMYNIKSIISGNQWYDALNRIDICLVAVPYGVRKEYIEAISLKNKSLYVEKPFAISRQEHSYYCSLFPEYALAVGFQRRFYKTVWILNSLIRSEVFGNLREINYNQGTFSLKGGSSYLSNAKLSGGGIIIESSIHAIDQIAILTNAKSIQIQNSKLLNCNDIEYDASIEAEITSSTDKIIFNAELSALRNLDNGLTLIFDNAKISCDLSANSTIRVSSPKSTPFFIDELDENKFFASSVNESFYLFWMQFLKALELKTINFTSGISSLITTKFIEDIYASKT